MRHNRAFAFTLLMLVAAATTTVWPWTSALLQNDAARIETIAGTGRIGFDGDGGPAVRARLFVYPCRTGPLRTDS